MLLLLVALSAAQEAKQVGSFSVKANAEALVRKLQAEGKDAFLKQVVVKGKVFYRVYVRPGPKEPPVAKPEAPPEPAPPPQEVKEAEPEPAPAPPAAKEAPPAPKEAAPAVAIPDSECTMCHQPLTQGKVVHTALQMGCQACHTGVDASQLPHKFSGASKGLSAEPPQLCFGCHQQKDFSASTVHAPVNLGMCTSCHNPHSSAEAKLLVSAMPELCYQCHDQGGFQKKVVHAPVATGACTDCHAPHARNNPKLLLRRGPLLCRKCHPRVEKRPHAVVGFRGRGHPLRGKKDPLREGKPFECLSCHLPHASDWARLFRYKAESSFDLCLHCHQM